MFPFMNRQNIASPCNRRKKKPDKRCSVDFLKLEAKPIQNIRQPRPKSKIKPRQMAIKPRRLKGPKSPFFVKIQRKNKENSPLFKKNLDISLIGSHIVSPNRNVKINRIHNLVSPAPIVSKPKARNSGLGERQMSVFKIRPKKAVGYFRKQKFSNQVKYPKAFNKRKISLKENAARQRYASQNNLSQMLEVIVRTPQSRNESTKVNSKETRPVKTSEKSEVSYEDLGKGLVVIVSGENSLSHSPGETRGTSKQIGAKVGNSTKET